MGTKGSTSVTLLFFMMLPFSSPSKAQFVANELLLELNSPSATALWMQLNEGGKGAAIYWIQRKLPPLGHDVIDIDPILIGAPMELELDSPEADLANDLGRIFKVTFRNDRSKVEMEHVLSQLQKYKVVVQARTNAWVSLQDSPLPMGAFLPYDYFLEGDTRGYWREGSWGQPYPDLWALQRIQLLEAFAFFADFGDPYELAGSHVLIAVIDSGIDFDHPDLRGRRWTNAGEFGWGRESDGIDNDGNGLIDDWGGWNFGDENDNVADFFGHGTHVAGTIAATLRSKFNERSGSHLGVAPNSKILAIKAFAGSSGNSTEDKLARSLIYAANQQASIINNSWACVNACELPLVEKALQYAYAKGSLAVFAAGNSNRNAADISPQNRPEAFTVSASTPRDTRADFSNYGSVVAVSAPGGDDSTRIYSQNILSLRSADAPIPLDSVVPDSRDGDPHLAEYVRFAGTSMAAPHVAGIAALVISYSRLHCQGVVPTNGELTSILRMSIDVHSDPKGKYFGSGRINARKALDNTFLQFDCGRFIAQ